VVAVSIKTYGTKRATSAFGDLDVIASAIPLASNVASSLVCGFNFQFPEMNGFRAMNNDVDDDDDDDDDANHGDINELSLRGNEDSCSDNGYVE
jgi:hypothetical protein